MTAVTGLYTDPRMSMDNNFVNVLVFSVNCFFVCVIKFSKA